MFKIYVNFIISTKFYADQETFQDELTSNTVHVLQCVIVLIFSQADKQTQLMVDAAQQLKHNCTLINTIKQGTTTKDIDKIINEKLIDVQQIIDMVVLDIRKLKPNRSFSMSGTKSSQSPEINISNNNISSSLSNWCKQLRSYSPTKDSVIVGLLSRKCQILCLYEYIRIDLADY
uniref:Uncharacterized protein n=1 Tax=Schistosoma haematobium TaxID=6185 RepID=A0A094ZH57_SCHHA